MVRVNGLVAGWWVGRVESVTVTFTVPLLAAAGVPEITPLEALMDSPVGRPVADQV